MDIDVSAIHKVEIFPCVGIARVGNSDAYFVGPEIPGRNDTPHGGFKDGHHAVKRQAARFRVYAFDANGQALGELNSQNGFNLTWSVEVANKKAAWYTFMGRTQPGAFQPGNTTLRNPTVQPNVDPELRTDLIVAPGAKQIEGRSTGPVDMTGHFKGSTKTAVDVYLGSLRTDHHGRLLVLPGHGLSRSIEDPNDPYPLILTDFDSPNWIDDTCDGTVGVSVRHTHSHKTFAPSSTARVIGTTPKFCSEIFAPTSLFDLIENVYAQARTGGTTEVGKVEYWRDIWPILQRPSLLAWVNGQANGGHGPNGAGNFFEPSWQLALRDPSPASASVRKIILGRLRLPETAQNAQARAGQSFPYFMPWLSGDGGRTTDGDPTTFTALTELQHARLQKWADGDFTVGQHHAPPASFEDIPVRAQPGALNRASLEWTIGAPLYPGIEMSWNAEEGATYDLSPEAQARPSTLGWRINDCVKPGDLTKFLSLPWQSDFYMCRNYWWPSARPDAVVPQEAWQTAVKTAPKGIDAATLAKSLSNRVPWERGLHQNYTDAYPDQPLFANTDMAQNWHRLGFVVKVVPPGHEAPPGPILSQPIFVETQRQNPHSQDVAHAGSARGDDGPVTPLELKMPRPDKGGRGGNSPIQSIESLIKHLQFAMAVELSTIPLYLFAMYSIKLPAAATGDPRYFDPVTDAFRGIVSEEMLHLSLAGNVLKAVGGQPKLYDKRVFPVYPMTMPGRVPTLWMRLRAATKQNLITFVEVELPESGPDPQPQADEYQSLGQFYLAVQIGLKYLAGELGPELFKPGSIPFQFAPGVGYQPRVHDAGGSVVIKDIATALHALEIIIEQGEGAKGEFDDPLKQEKAHYYIFKGLMDGPSTWEVYPVKENPQSRDYLAVDKRIYEVSKAFDAAYCYLLLTIETLWTVSDDDKRKKLVLGNLYGLMLGVLAPLAKFLVQQELVPGKVNAAPCFGWFEFGKLGAGDPTAFQQLNKQMKKAISAYVDVTRETPDQVPVRSFGAQLEALLPVQNTVTGLLDIATFETGAVNSLSKKGLGGEKRGYKGFAKGF